MWGYKPAPPLPRRRGRCLVDPRVDSSGSETLCLFVTWCLGLGGSLAGSSPGGSLPSGLPFPIKGYGGVTRMIGRTILLALMALTVEVQGHGRLMDPPARNAMWRYGYQNPVNYNDNELYCGGFVVHYQVNKGKCGVCGDDYREKVPRNHEAGGVFANGIIVKRYIVGQEITITADLTTNHYGWMETKICPNDDPNKKVTQECLDKHPLPLVGTNSNKFEIPKGSKKVETFTWRVKLPDGITCSQCVIQWTYFAGNTWGACLNGTEDVGCGDQETFINCADVEILSNTPVIKPDSINPWQLFYRGDQYSAVTRTTDNNTTQALRPLVIKSQLCIPIGEYENVKGMDDWCRVNCLKYPPTDCDPRACKCVHECVAIGEFAKKRNGDIFCHQNCLGHPSVCPKERCKCF